MPYESPPRQRDGRLPRCTAALPRASRGLQRAPGARVCTRKRATARSLSGGGAAHALEVCARRAALVEVGSCPLKAHCASETALSLVHNCAPTCQPGPPTSSRRSRVRTRERATARSLSGGGAARAFAACARCAAVVEVGPCHINAHSVSEAALSLGARACLDVPAAASDKQPAFACAHARTRHRVLSLGRRRSTRACGVRAPSRNGWSRITALLKLAAPARRPSPSLHGRAPTCQPGPPTQPAFTCAQTHSRLRVLSLGRRRSTRACGVHAPRRAG